MPADNTYMKIFLFFHRKGEGGDTKNITIGKDSYTGVKSRIEYLNIQSSKANADRPLPP